MSAMTSIEHTHQPMRMTRHRPNLPPFSTSLLRRSIVREPSWPRALRWVFRQSNHWIVVILVPNDRARALLQVCTTFDHWKLSELYPVYCAIRTFNLRSRPNSSISWGEILKSVLHSKNALWQWKVLWFEAKPTLLAHILRHYPTWVPTQNHEPNISLNSFWRIDFKFDICFAIWLTI